MDINSMLRYMPEEGDIIMHKDGSYHVVKETLKQGSMSVKAEWFVHGDKSSEVSLNIPKVRASMIQGKQFLVRKSDESR